MNTELRKQYRLPKFKKFFNEEIIKKLAFYKLNKDQKNSYFLAKFKSLYKIFNFKKDYNVK